MDSLPPVHPKPKAIRPTIALTPASKEVANVMHAVQSAPSPLQRKGNHNPSPTAAQAPSSRPAPAMPATGIRASSNQSASATSSGPAPAMPATGVRASLNQSASAASAGPAPAMRAMHISSAATPKATAAQSMPQASPLATPVALSPAMQAFSALLSPESGPPTPGSLEIQKAWKDALFRKIHNIPSAIPEIQAKRVRDERHLGLPSPLTKLAIIRTDSAPAPSPSASSTPDARTSEPAESPSSRASTPFAGPTMEEISQDVRGFQVAIGVSDFKAINRYLNGKTQHSLLPWIDAALGSFIRSCAQDRGDSKGAGSQESSANSYSSNIVAALKTAKKEGYDAIFSMLLVGEFKLALERAIKYESLEDIRTLLSIEALDDRIWGMWSFYASQSANPQIAQAAEDPALLFGAPQKAVQSSGSFLERISGISLPPPIALLNETVTSSHFDHNKELSTPDLRAQPLREEVPLSSGERIRFVTPKSYNTPPTVRFEDRAILAPHSHYPDVPTDLTSPPASPSAEGAATEADFNDALGSGDFETLNALMGQDIHPFHIERALDSYVRLFRKAKDDVKGDAPKIDPYLSWIQEHIDALRAAGEKGLVNLVEALKKRRLQPEIERAAQQSQERVFIALLSGCNLLKKSFHEALEKYPNPYLKKWMPTQFAAACISKFFGKPVNESEVRQVLHAALAELPMVKDRQDFGEGSAEKIERALQATPPLRRYFLQILDAMMIPQRKVASIRERESESAKEGIARDCVEHIPSSMMQLQVCLVHELKKLLHLSKQERGQWLPRLASIRFPHIMKELLLDGPISWKDRNKALAIAWKERLFTNFCMLAEIGTTRAEKRAIYSQVEGYLKTDNLSLQDHGALLVAAKQFLATNLATRIEAFQRTCGEFIDPSDIEEAVNDRRTLFAWEYAETGTRRLYGLRTATDDGYLPIVCYLMREMATHASMQEAVIAHFNHMNLALIERLLDPSHNLPNFLIKAALTKVLEQYSQGKVAPSHEQIVLNLAKEGYSHLAMSLLGASSRSPSKRQPLTSIHLSEEDRGMWLVQHATNPLSSPQMLQALLLDGPISSDHLSEAFGHLLRQNRTDLALTFLMVGSEGFVRGAMEVLSHLHIQLPKRKYSADELCLALKEATARGHLHYIRNLLEKANAQVIKNLAEEGTLIKIIRLCSAAEEWQSINVIFKLIDIDKAIPIYDEMVELFVVGRKLREGESLSNDQIAQANKRAHVLGCDHIYIELNE